MSSTVTGAFRTAALSLPSVTLSPAMHSALLVLAIVCFILFVAMMLMSNRTRAAKPIRPMTLRVARERAAQPTPQPSRSATASPDVETGDDDEDASPVLDLSGRGELESRTSPVAAITDAIRTGAARLGRAIARKRAANALSRINDELEAEELADLRGVDGGLPPATTVALASAVPSLGSPAAIAAGEGFAIEREPVVRRASLSPTLVELERTSFPAGANGSALRPASADGAHRESPRMVEDDGFEITFEEPSRTAPPTEARLVRHAPSSDVAATAEPEITYEDEDEDEDEGVDAALDVVGTRASRPVDRNDTTSEAVAVSAEDDARGADAPTAVPGSASELDVDALLAQLEVDRTSGVLDAEHERQRAEEENALRATTAKLIESVTWTRRYLGESSPTMDAYERVRFVQVLGDMDDFTCAAPTLYRALREEPDPEVLLAIYAALTAAYNDQVLMPAHELFLDHEDPRMRDVAARGIADLTRVPG